MDFAFRGTETSDAWNEWAGNNFAVADGAVTIAEDPDPSYGAPAEVPVEFEPVDIALDECGDLYLISASGEIHRYDRVRESLERLPCTWRPAEAGAATAIAVTRRSIYVSGENGHVHAYARRLHQTRWTLSEPFESPVALAASGETLLVLDEGTGHQEAGFLAGVGADAGVERLVEGLTTPMDIATRGSEETHILTGPDGDRTVDEFDADFGRTATTGIPDAYDAKCLAAEPGGRLLLGLAVPTPGQPALVRLREGSFERIDPITETMAELALSHDGVRGRPDGLFAVVGDPGRVQFHESANRRQRNEATGLHDAQIVRRFDAGERGTEWHRVTADLSLGGPGTQVRLRYLATDDPDLRYREELVSLESVDGIGPTYADRLRAAGVRGLSELVERSPEDVARAVSTETLDVPESRVTEWVEAGHGLLEDRDHPVDLEAIDGIGPTFAGRLRDAGIEDVSDLVDRTAAAVARIVSAGVYDIPPSRAETWIEDAREELAARDDVRGLEWSTMDRPNPRDALLTDAEGRYLWVELDLHGEPFATPRVDAFRAYYPRQSYLRHLPAVYEDDPGSAAFLERFLSIFESVFVDVEEEIEAVTRYFDPTGIPPEHLSWLGDWLAVEAGETWPEPARRELIAKAPELFKKRGTREGLLEILRIYFRHASDGRADGGHRPSDWTGGEDAPSGATQPAGVEGLSEENPPVFLLEHSDLDCIDDPSVREDYERIIPCPQCFMVMVRSSFSDEAMRAVERVVEREQPAHSVGRAIQLQPWIQLGGNSYLGINTRLSKRNFVVEESGLGRDSVLTEREPDGQLGISSRIGNDTTLS